MTSLSRIMAATLVIWLPSEYSITNSGSDNRFESLSEESLVCVFEMNRKMPDYSRMDTGYNYELLSNFSTTYHCTTKAYPAQDSTDYVEMLRDGGIDILICNRTDTLDLTGIYCSQPMEHGVVWLMRKERDRDIKQLDSWMRYASNEAGITTQLKKRFYRTFNPHSRYDRGMHSSVISPYDDLIQKYAVQLGWDWRMLAAVIYQESMFAIGTSSHRGAFGLMQMVQNTADIYGETDLMDPEKSIAAGTRHLVKLQRFFIDTDIVPSERIKFTIAAYNAGLARVADIRNLAAMMGINCNSWERAVSVIPYMRDREILNEEAVKCGIFQGYETIKYVESTLRIYNQFVELSSPII